MRLICDSIEREIPPCEGFDDWAHQVFVVTNEDKATETIKTLSKTTISANTIIGVSGFFILNVAAARGSLSQNAKKIDHIILCDRSLRVEHFWKKINLIVMDSTTKEETTRKIKQLLVDQHEAYFSGDPCKMSSKEAADLYIKKLDLEIEQKISWLSTDKNFKKIQTIFKMKSFYFLRIDLKDPENLTYLNKALHLRNMDIDTLYLSNIDEYGPQTRSPSTLAAKWTIRAASQHYKYLCWVEQVVSATSAQSEQSAPC